MIIEVSECSELTLEQIKWLERELPKKITFTIFQIVVAENSVNV